MSDCFDHEFDAFSDLLDGQTADEGRQYSRYSGTSNNGKTCNYCGQHGLKWLSIGGKWRLYDKTEQHICSEYKETKL